MKLAFLLCRALVGTAALATTLVFSQVAHAQTAYSLAENGASLIRFDLATPGDVTVIGAISGSTQVLDGLDFRVSNGLLYGYVTSGNQLVTVDLNTAATTFVSSPATGSTASTLGIDFNPTVDRLRLVNTDRQNLRITPGTGVTDVDGLLTYAAGDANTGIAPNIIDAAYTNNDTNAATGTTLYYIDYVASTLVTTAAPNNGTLNTVGLLNFQSDEFVGFDIFTSAPNVNAGYATLTVGGVTGLYSINLGTGAATFRGELAATDVYGLAIRPTVAAAAPEPGTFALLATGLLPFAGLVARRRAR